MSRHTMALLAAALALSFAACSPAPPEPTDPPEDIAAVDPADATTMPPAAGATDDAMQPAGPGLDGHCDADAVQSLVGEQATDEVVEQARTDAGATLVRTLGPDEVVTLEYREGRLNVDVDDDGTITGLRCG